ncbi:MAG: 2-oxo acid dehydrogenase subunit E2 [Actinomycetota bacterium]|nr:2-oxo acid dehydrogenase subunit E2 [Actinomycetota bacterium]
MAVFKLPDLGEGVTEAEVDKWLVKEGDVIKEDDPLVEVITDKATAEIPSPYEGVVNRIHVAEGDVVTVGTTLVTIGEDAAQTSAATTKIKALPPVRKLARELGIDLGSVVGSGPEGRILRADVEAAAGSELAAPPVEVEALEERRREPLRGVRRKIAERMLLAHQTIPPVTHVEECDVTELDATRRLANERSPGGVRLTFLPFIVKAVVTALKDHPALNASLDEEAGEIVYHQTYNIGVAVDTPQGLVVPVVKAADSKRLIEIGAEIERLAAAARETTLRTDDLQSGTFTITSPGPYGGLMATPIVMHPQAAILGVHRAVDRAVVRDGQIVVRKIMNLSVTFDHRILDGMTAAKFTLDVVRLLEHPAVLALES